jgi:hypothetical protein
MSDIARIHASGESGLTPLSVFEADALQTAKDIDELGAHIEGRYPGGAARCRRAAELLWELLAATSPQGTPEEGEAP